MSKVPNAVVRQAAYEALAMQHDKSVMLTAFDQLKPSERIFVSAYVATDNPVRAIIAANPALDSNPHLAQVRAFDMLKRPLVQAAIAQKIEKLAEKYDVSVEALVRELAFVAKANMADYVRITPEGEPYVDLSEATPEMMAAIQSVKVEDVKEGRGEDAREIRRVTFQLHDKLRGIDMLMKRHGAYAPVGMNVNVTGGLTVQHEPVKETMTAEQAADHYQRSLESE